MNGLRFSFLQSDSSLPTTGQETNRKPKRRRAVILLLLTLTLGSVSALTHHFMNHSLNDNEVSSFAWSQQWSSYFGTALAFLTQVLFASCARVAFVQRQWLNMSTRHEAIRVKDIDTLSNALTDPFSLLFPLLWRKHPLLFTMATLSWIIPFAALITPGTLSVELKPLATSLDLRAPKLSLDYGPYTDNNVISESWSGGLTFDLEPAQRLYKLAFDIAASSQVSPMKPYSANQTFTLSSIGPALECVEANETMITQIGKVADTATLSFLSWAGEVPPWLQKVPMNPESVGTFNFPFLVSAAFQEPNTTENTIWVVSCVGNCTDFMNTNYNVVRCQLWNASYEVQLIYQNFEQTSTIQNITYSNPILTPAYDTAWWPPFVADKTLAYRAVMYTIGSLLIGYDDGIELKTNRGLLNINFNSSEQIIRGLEEFSHNLTLSLFSVPEFLANDTDTVATNITTWTNVYQYRPRYLLLIYGLIFLLSGVCCLIGLHAIHNNGSSFQNNFSTHIRAVRSSDLNIEAMLPSTDIGADPLPECLGNQFIKLNPRNEKP